MNAKPLWMLVLLTLSARASVEASDGEARAAREIAQDASEPPPAALRPYLYGNAAFGRCNHDYTIFGGGGGAEVFPGRRLGIGADLGYYEFSDDNSFGVYSLTVALHFPGDGEPRRADPYISISPGFYTSEVGPSGGSFGFGGGLNYWFGDRWGLHTDFRAALLGTEEGIVLVRVGIAFR